MDPRWLHVANVEGPTETWEGEIALNKGDRERLLLAVVLAADPNAGRVLLEFQVEK